jgi:hypothetical protein
VLLPETLTALGTEELLQAVSAEMMHLHAAGAGVRLEIHPAMAFAVVAMCQLGMRHPGAETNGSTPLVKEFIDLVQTKFLPWAPAIAEAIRRGNDPACDRPRDGEPHHAA